MKIKNFVLFIMTFIFIPSWGKEPELTSANPFLLVLDQTLGSVVESLDRSFGFVNPNYYSEVNLSFTTKNRLNNIRNKILNFSGHTFFNKNFQILVLKKTPRFQFAITKGHSIYISDHLVNILNDRELTAIIAHELAHIEKAHNVKSLSFPLGAGIHSAKSLISKQPHQSIPQILDETALGLEIEADCIMAQWLMTMRQRGLWHHKNDLIRAFYKILNIQNIYELYPDSDIYLRINAIMNGVKCQ